MFKGQKWKRVAELRAASQASANAGKLDHAVTLAAQATQLAHQTGGLTDPRVAECFLQLADLQVQSGDLNGAEPNYNAACTILNPTEGETTPLKAELLLAYGSLYANMRLGWRAILFLGHARDRFEELHGENHEGVGRAQALMAVSYESAGMEEEALRAYAEAHRILSLARGASHPSVTYLDWCRADLVFWRAMKSGDETAARQAMEDFHAALRMTEEAEGAQGRNVASRRAMLGAYHVVRGDYKEGARLLTEGIAVLQAAGEGTAPYCRQLARARIRLGDASGAFDLLRQAITQDPVGHWVAHGSDHERMDSLGRTYANLSQYLDLLLASGTTDPVVIREACDLVLARKALGAELLATQRRAVSRGDDPELAALMSRLAEARAAVATQRLAGQDVAGEVLAEIERIEWEIASRVPEMDLDPLLRAVNTEAVSARLPNDAVLVEFVRFTRRETIEADPDAWEDGRRDWYIAFVVSAGSQGSLTLVDLGAAPGIDTLVHEYHQAVARPDASGPAMDHRRDIGRDDEEPPAERNDGSALRSRLVEPWLSRIGAGTRLVIVPDGDLTRVPFGALPDGNGGCMIDRHDISYLSSGRDLLRQDVARPASTGVPLVIADPDYDAPRRVASPHASGVPAVGDRDLLRAGLVRAGRHFSRLPGTITEGHAVARWLGVEPCMGSAAREELVKAAQAPMIVHIATHGFFLPGPAAPSDEGAHPGDVLRVASQHPLVRSGLALAGANAWLRGDAPSQYEDDGILNGEDIVAMDLTATELVVLSACESGLGDVVAGEGVMGLRRAFAVAGARTLIVSLWKVPDEQTQALMLAFYCALLQGKGRAEALREAQQAVRASHPAPFYWAAFICQGDPHPIPSYRARKT